MSVKNTYPVLWDYSRMVDNLRIQILRNPIKTPLCVKFEVKAFKSIEVGA